MDNTSRMAVLAKGQGAPPDEPPMAPPGMSEGEDQKEPPLAETLPAIADYLDQAMGLAESDDQKSKIQQASQLLREASNSKPPQDEGMGQADAEAYGESTPEK